MESTKICPSCKTPKPYSQFGRAPRPDGCASYCHACFNKYKRSRWTPAAAAAQKAKRQKKKAEAAARQEMDAPVQVCPWCLRALRLTEQNFHWTRLTGFDTVCKDCIDSVAEQYQHCGQASKKRSLAEARRFRTLLTRFRIRAMQHYSGPIPFCACCGEAEFLLLTIDHINDDGAEHRRRTRAGTGGNFYRWLVSQGFPDGFIVTCFSCNCARSAFGTCPHERRRNEKEAGATPASPVPGVYQAATSPFETKTSMSG